MPTAATASAKKVLAENLKQRAHKDAKILADAQALAEKIANLPLTIAMKAEQGKIFGSATSSRSCLAEALWRAEKASKFDRKTITVEAIKNVGEYEASAKLHREVKATITATVWQRSKRRVFSSLLASSKAANQRVFALSLTKTL